MKAKQGERPEIVNVSKIVFIHYLERVPVAAVSAADIAHAYAYGTHGMTVTQDGRCTVEDTGRAALRKVRFVKDGEAYLYLGCTGSAIALTSGLPAAVTAETHEVAYIYDETFAPTNVTLPVGTRKANFGTNHPGTPERAGQLGVFMSPYSHSSWLVDIAEPDGAGNLQWVALPIDDPRYEKEIAKERASLGKGRMRMAKPLTSRMLAEQYPAKGSMPQPVVKQLYQLREAEVAELSRRSVVTEADIRDLDRGARGMVADLLYAKCDDACRHALLHDEHAHVRCFAVGSQAELEAGRKASGLAIAA